jgi:hypothetical protein
LHRWRTHISGIPDAKGVTSDAKTSSDAKMPGSGGTGETDEAGVVNRRPFPRVKDFESACPAFILFDQVFQ